MRGGLRAIFAGFALGCLPPVYATEPAEPPPPAEVEPPAEPPSPSSGSKVAVVAVAWVVEGPYLEGPLTVYWADVDIKRRPDPWRPEIPIPREVDCVLRFVVDTRGRASVTPARCRTGFVEVSLEAAERWRFRPYLVDGVPTEVQFLYTFKFAADAP